MHTTSRRIGSGRQTGRDKNGRWWLPGGGEKEIAGRNASGDEIEQPGAEYVG